MTALQPSLEIANLLGQAAGRLSAAGIEGAPREARLLLEHVAAIPIATQIAFGERSLTASQAEAFDQAIARRVTREPLSHILGRREFWSLDFKVNGDTLDPRADSETLVEAVLRQVAAQGIDRHRQALSLIDLGTGTGCLLLALLSELPMARGLGVDINPGAVSVAAANAERLGLAARAVFRQSDWDREVTGIFDIIISNPPYIPSAEIDGLQPEVACYEPRLALDGGADGLSAYRAIARAMPRLKAPGGFAALEIGHGQANAVDGIMTQACLLRIAAVRDLQGHDRVLLFH